MIPEIMIIDLLNLINKQKPFHYNYHCLDSYTGHVFYTCQRMMCLIKRSMNSLNIKKVRLVIWSNASVMCKIESQGSFSLGNRHNLYCSPTFNQLYIFIYEIDIDKKVRQMKLLLYGYIMTVKKYSPIQSGYWKPNAIVLKLSIIFFAISCPNM